VQQASAQQGRNSNDDLIVNMSWRDRGVILYLDHHGGRKHGNDSSHLQTSDHFMHERHGQQDRKHGFQAACHYRACWIQIFQSVK